MSIRLLRWLLRSGVVAVLCMGVVACASSQRQADDELRAGFKAAKRGYWQEALLRFELAQKMEPNNSRALSNYAVALEAVGRYDEARAAYERAMAGPDNRVATKNYSRFEEFYHSFIDTNLAEEKTPQEKTPEPKEEEAADEAHS